MTSSAEASFFFFYAGAPNAALQLDPFILLPRINRDILLSAISFYDYRRFNLRHLRFRAHPALCLRLPTAWSPRTKYDISRNTRPPLLIPYIHSANVPSFIKLKKPLQIPYILSRLPLHVLFYSFFPYIWPPLPYLPRISDDIAFSYARTKYD